VETQNERAEVRDKMPVATDISLGVKYHSDAKGRLSTQRLTSKADSGGAPIQKTHPFEYPSQVRDKVVVPPVPEDRIGARVTEIDVVVMIRG